MKSYLHAPELTDDVIEKAFEGTNFGRTDYREFLGYSVLKIACGWHCGHTITKIIIEMGLITPKNKTLTKLGRMFLSDCYDDPLRAATPPAASAPDVNFDLPKPGTEATVITHYQVPDGWKLVPIEPSKEMLLASKRYKAKTKVPTGPGVYRAMIAAAPEPGDKK